MVRSCEVASVRTVGMTSSSTRSTPISFADARPLKAVLHAHQLELPAVDAAFLVDVLHGVGAALGDVLALVRGGTGQVHQVADLDGLSIGGGDAEAQREQAEHDKQNHDDLLRFQYAYGHSFQ